MGLQFAFIFWIQTNIWWIVIIIKYVGDLHRRTVIAAPPAGEQETLHSVWHKQWWWWWRGVIFSKNLSFKYFRKYFVNWTQFSNSSSVSKVCRFPALHHLLFLCRASHCCVSIFIRRSSYVVTTKIYWGGQWVLRSDVLCSCSDARILIDAHTQKKHFH